MPDPWQPLAEQIVYGLAVVLYLWTVWKSVPYWRARFVLACFVFLPPGVQLLLMASLLVWAHTKQDDEAPRKLLLFVPRSLDLPQEPR